MVGFAMAGAGGTLVGLANLEQFEETAAAVLKGPLSAAALESETGYWKAVDSRFTLSALSDKRVAQLRG